MPRTVSQDENPDYQLTLRMLSEFQETWKELNAEAGIDPMKFSRLSVIALTQLSAIVAVDVGMTVEQFTNVCAAQHQEAFKRAPKFG